MMIQPLGYAGDAHSTATTRHGWSKALQLAPDLYPGVGGKRFRAELVQRSFEFAGGRGEAPAAIVDAVEMLHAGSLVIDDFEDNSQMRRGQPALHRVVGPARAVNAGNWMYFRAVELAGRAYDDSEKKAALLAKVVEIARQCHEGQAIDLATKVDEVTPRQARAAALAISRWKTGRLVHLAAWCGAYAAGGSAAKVRAASAFGGRVGVCLQMRNDLDEVVAFAAGGNRCDDLRNRRVTWPWAWAAQKLPPSRFLMIQQRLQRALQQPSALQAVARSLIAASHDRGSPAINERLDRAVSRLNAVAHPSGAGRALAEMTESLRMMVDVREGVASR